MAPVDARAKLDQIRRNKNKQKNKPAYASYKVDNGNVKDLRQIIVKKSKRKDDRSPNRTAQGRITKHNKSNSAPAQRDLRESNRKLASRRNLSQTRDKDTVSTGRRIDTRASNTRTTRPVPVVKERTIANTQPVKIGKKIVQQQQYYVPPHMQRNQPTYMMSGPATITGRKSNLAMDSVHHDQPSVGSASILISNLSTEATQSDIIEIFGNVGVMTAVNIINQTTALVTYQNSSDAVRAVKFYNNRLLDGKPMLVNMMPSTI